jgi:carbon monoxide dehydrogenase subunit G
VFETVNFDDAGTTPSLPGGIACSTNGGMKIVRRVVIQAKPEKVWDVITDLRRAREWAPGFDDYPYISELWPRAGADALWRYHFGNRTMDFRLKMIESVRGSVIRIGNSGAFGEGLECYLFTYADGATTVDYETSTDPSLLGRLMLPLLRRKLLRQVDTTIANLKLYCERKDRMA